MPQCFNATSLRHCGLRGHVVCSVAVTLALALISACSANAGAAQSTDVQASFPFDLGMKNVFPSWDVDTSLLFLIPPDPTDVR